MFCNNCGKELEETAMFCTSCGAKIEKTEPAETISRDTAVQPVAVQEETVRETFVQPQQPMQNYAAPAEKEKVFFGKGAFAFCLVVIGLLSVSTGIFAGLYFSVI